MCVVCVCVPLCVYVCVCVTGRFASTFIRFYALCKSARWPFANVDIVISGLASDPAGNSCRAFHPLLNSRALSRRISIAAIISLRTVRYTKVLGKNR